MIVSVNIVYIYEKREPALKRAVLAEINIA